MERTALRKQMERRIRKIGNCIKVLDHRVDQLKHLARLIHSLSKTELDNIALDEANWINVTLEIDRHNLNVWADQHNITLPNAGARQETDGADISAEYFITKTFTFTTANGNENGVVERVEIVRSIGTSTYNDKKNAKSASPLLKLRFASNRKYGTYQEEAYLRELLRAKGITAFDSDDDKSHIDRMEPNSLEAFYEEKLSEQWLEVKNVIDVLYGFIRREANKNSANVSTAHDSDN